MAIPFEPLGNINRILSQAAIAQNHYITKATSLEKQTNKIIIDNIRFVSPDFHSDLHWNNHIIGLDLDYANVRVRATPNRNSGHIPLKVNPPKSIIAELTRRPPKSKDGIIDNDDKVKTSTLLSLLLREDLSTDQIFIYTNESSTRISQSLLPSNTNNRITVASIVRKGGSSDEYFRKGNNFVNRGSAIEGNSDKDYERPLARKLFLTGGVEVLEIKIKPQPNAKIDNRKEYSDKILIKSPANIFYYSGHGESTTGALTSVEPYIYAEDLLKAWKSSNHIFKSLVIAGCSVISIHKVKGERHGYSFDKIDRSGPGMKWAKLLESKGGKVSSICGHWAAAPLDDQKGGRTGNEIGSRMGKKIVQNYSAVHADSWMKIHYDMYIDESVDRTTYAAALKDNVFLYMEYSWENRIGEETIEEEKQEK